MAFKNEDFTKRRFPRGEYDTCTFTGCDLSGADLTASVFIDCDFVNCNMSLVKLVNTTLADAKFSTCKMIGLAFDECNETGLSVSFKECNLNNALFCKVKLARTGFADCNLAEADFSGADLRSSVFDRCDLNRAVFTGANLEKADLRTSFNTIIDPEHTNIRKMKISLHNLPGLLVKYDLDID